MSTSVDRNSALWFILDSKNQEEDFINVLLTIKLKGICNYVILDEISEYENEEEVLMNEGLSLEIQEIKRESVKYNGKEVEIQDVHCVYNDQEFK